MIVQYQVKRKDVIIGTLLMARYSKFGILSWLWFFFVGLATQSTLLSEAKTLGIGWAIFVILFVALLATAVLLFTCIAAGTMSAFTSKPGEGRLGSHTITITPSECLDKTNADETHVVWSAVGKVLDTSNYVLIWLKTGAVYGVPKRAFATPQAAQDFFTLAKKYHHEAAKLPT